MPVGLKVSTGIGSVSLHLRPYFRIFVDWQFSWWLTFHPHRDASLPFPIFTHYYLLDYRSSPLIPVSYMPGHYLTLVSYIHIEKHLYPVWLYRYRP